jgi:glutathione S-transferase
VGTEHVFHLALAADWEAARVAGDYRVSTLGVTLEQEGFLHAAFAHQWEDVRRRFYADVVDPLVLLVIDPDLLDVPLVVETAEGADQAFPHIYGPLPVAAVAEVRPVLVRDGASRRPDR